MISNDAGGASCCHFHYEVTVDASFQTKSTEVVGYLSNKTIDSKPPPHIARKVIEQFRHLADRDRATRHSEPDLQQQTSASLRTPSSDDDSDAPARSGSGIDALTSKEETILELIAEGKSNKDIARTMFLAEGTVKNYVGRIMEKLHTHAHELAVKVLRDRRT